MLALRSILSVGISIVDVNIVASILILRLSPFTFNLAVCVTVHASPASHTITMYKVVYSVCHVDRVATCRFLH